MTRKSSGLGGTHGIALNPNHKKVIVADMRLNANVPPCYQSSFSKRMPCLAAM